MLYEFLFSCPEDPFCPTSRTGGILPDSHIQHAKQASFLGVPGFLYFKL
jgi:hypothetical protein